MIIDHLRKTTGNNLFLGSHPGIIQSMLDYAYLAGHDKPAITAIIAKGRKQERYFWGESEVSIPVVPAIDNLSGKQRAGITNLVNAQSGRRVLDSTSEAVHALENLKVAVIFAENTPERHALELATLAKAKDILLLGPASVGLLIPPTLKLGAIGGTQHPQISRAGIITPGDTAVISSSGGMVNELIHSVTGSGAGLSFAMALGGERYPMTTPAEAFLLAEQDAATGRVVYFGELGGSDEYEIVRLIEKKKLTKPVIAYIAGSVAELFEAPPQFGHAKALAQHDDETAKAKKASLRSVGVKVLNSFDDLSAALLTTRFNAPEHSAGRTIGPRRKHLASSRLSGDVDGDVNILGKDLLSFVNQNDYASLILSMLLGHEVHSKKLIGFMDFVLRLLADHGPYVSGAANTIITARAGRDLVSGLAAGLLTVGPRFGGAINMAAANWLRGVAASTDARDFVSSFTADGGIIAGIGHKKYSIENPDPRVSALVSFAGNRKTGRYLRFATEVEKVTTSKKGNLILNVDGVIAAVMMDLLVSETSYSHKQLQELVDIEFFNALFVLSRSVGLTAHYLDQRRHDEGLLRLGPDEIVYLPGVSGDA